MTATINNTPEYKITPYFVLTGLEGGGGDSVYVNKLHYNDDKWYQSNFVLDKEGLPLSYITDPETNVVQYTASKFSYSDIEYFEVTSPKTISVYLTAGIYAFNMSAPAMSGVYSGSVTV